jgi:hypothetical protein
LAEKKANATFAGVEMGQATLTVSASDTATIPLGNSISYDLAELIQMDAMQPVSEYVNELTVAILPENDGGVIATDELVTSAVCTVTLKLTYRPSPKDQREELYELLNKTTQRKSKSVEKLRQMAVAAARAQAQSGPAANKKPPAVQAGFLNKPTKKQIHWSVQWYNKHLGPASIVRTVLPIAKNYIIFFGAVGFLHFKGQMLALPRPV